MPRLRTSMSIVCIALVLLAPTAGAHSPAMVGENDSLATALTVQDPAKSWAFYDDIHKGGEAKYFKLELKTGDRLYAGVFLPDNTGFLPRIAALGPGLVDEGYLPPFVDVPAGYGHVVVNGTIKGKEYEPFTPGSYYQIGNIDITVNRSGTYYIAVFEPDRGGNYGIAIGYIESFTLQEWLLIPASVIEINLWEGQPLALILAPLALALLLGIPAIFVVGRRKGMWPFTPAFWIGAVAALMFIGTGAMTLMQMAMALSAASDKAGGLVTAVFAAVPIALGVVALRAAAAGVRGPWPRIKMGLVGATGLLLWGGLFIGPALAFVAAVLPARMSGKASRSGEGPVRR